MAAKRTKKPRGVQTGSTAAQMTENSHVEWLTTFADQQRRWDSGSTAAATKEMRPARGKGAMQTAGLVFARSSSG
jgi:hypothetical protein